jgi:multidrug resistance efflux pump
MNAIQVYPETLQMTVQGFGTVKPRMEVQVVPQVSGKVIQCHPQLVNGGFFRAEEPLVVIEQTDYTLAVESADAAVAQAEVKVEQEKAEADVAHQEWEKLHPDKEPDSILNDTEDAV